MRKVVVNTTPLIALSHVEQIHLLKRLYGEIIIPEAVFGEVSVKPESACKKAVDSSLDWIRVEKGIYISQSLVELCLKQAGEI